MSWSLRIRLSLMMFLEFAVPGAWAPFLYPYLKGPVAEGGLGFSPQEAILISTVYALACLAAPFIGGQVADRWFPTQWFLAAAHVLGGVVMLFLAQQKIYGAFLAAAAIHALLYTPTRALVASLSFHHLREPDRQFGSIRVWGTIGWIVAGLALSGWRWLADKHGTPVPADMLYLAAICSFVMGVLCCFLPHTPPKKEAENPWAFLEALRLLKSAPFAIFLVIAFIVTTQLSFYYILASDFLKLGVGIAGKNIPAVMTVAQIAEIVVMAGLLAVALKKLGTRKTLVLGVLAWPLRYVIFALHGSVPYWVVVAALALHGVGYTFFFTVAQIYVNKIATADIRASAQSLLVLIMGLGGVLGTLFTRRVVGMLSTTYWKKTLLTDILGPELPDWIPSVITMQKGVESDWQWIFFIPCFLTVACALAFLLFFHDPRAERAPAEEAASGPAAEQTPAEEREAEEA